MNGQNKTNILKHFAIIGTGTLLNMIIGVLTTPVITRLVEPNEYGQFSIFSMYSNIAVMVLCLGLDQALIRYYYEKEEIDYKRALLFRCVKLPVILSFISTLVFMMLVSRHIITFEFSLQLTALLCLFTISQLIYRFSLLVLRLAYNSKLYSSLMLIHKVVYVVAALGLIIVFPNDKLLMLSIATTLSIIVCAFISVASQRNLWNICNNHDTKCHISKRELLKYGYPFIISMGLTTIFQAIDKISLNHYCSYEDVGIYSSTMTLVSIFAIIQSTFNSMWAPMAQEHYAADKNDRTFYQKGNQIITVIMFFLGISLILCKDLFAILLGSKYREAAYILPFLIFQPIMYTISETTVMGISFKKKSKMQILISAVACATNIIGNTVLVPILGCKGAALSTGFSYIVFFSMRTLISNKYFYVDFKLRRIYTLTIIVAIYAIYNTFVAFGIGSFMGYAVCLIALVLIYKDTTRWILNYICNIFMKFKTRKNG